MLLLKLMAGGLVVLKNADAAALMAEARAMQAEGGRLMAAGDWRDGAEKGWLAARNATAALVLEVTGVCNPHSTSISAGLRKLAQERGGEWLRMRERYGDIAHHLHSEAFYGGVYNEDLPAQVRGVADYIRRAVELAA